MPLRKEYKTLRVAAAVLLIAGTFTPISSQDRTNVREILLDHSYRIKSLEEQVLHSNQQFEASRLVERMAQVEISLKNTASRLDEVIWLVRTISMIAIGTFVKDLYRSVRKSGNPARKEDV